VKEYAVPAVYVKASHDAWEGPRSILVSAGGRPLQRLQRRPSEGFTDKLLFIPDLATTPIAGTGPGSVNASHLELFDMNGDGYLDLAVVCSTAPKWMNYQFWLYSPAQHRFVESPELNSIHGLTPRHGKLVVDEGLDAGALRFIYVYGFEGGKIVELRMHEIYWHPERKGISAPEGHAYIIEHERRGGKLVVTQERIVPYKDVDHE
jgi:hypothetical protein